MRLLLNLQQKGGMFFKSFSFSMILWITFASFKEDLL